MRRLASLALLAAACGLGSCGGAAPQSNAVDDLDIERSPRRSSADGLPFVWRVHGPQPSYLVGTIHAGVSGDEALLDVFWPYLDNARLVVLETSMEPTNIETGILPDGETLDQHLSGEAWQELSRLLGSRATEVQRYQPWLAHAALIYALHPTPLPMDAAVLQRARSLAKPVAHLENWQEQLSLLRSEVGIAELQELLEANGTARRQLSEIIGAYRGLSESQIVQATFAPQLMRKDPGHFDRVFFQRNRKWVQQLAEPLLKGGAFVAVGVGHLVGPNSLPKLLRERGFQVERVRE